jgi:hypothetical protein
MNQVVQDPILDWTARGSRRPSIISMGARVVALGHTSTNDWMTERRLETE